MLTHSATYWLTLSPTPIGTMLISKRTIFNSPRC
jgi:hypothetical protein